MSRRIQRVIVALSTASVGAFLLAACVSANQPAAQPNPTFSSESSATPGMSDMGSTSPAAPPVAPVGPNAVNIDGFAFAPATLTVKVGSTVTWTNKDEDPHTVVASDGSFRSQVLSAGGTYQFTFPKAGNVDYICSIHPFMHGTVVVTQ